MGPMDTPLDPSLPEQIHRVVHTIEKVPSQQKTITKICVKITEIFVKITI